MYVGGWIVKKKGLPLLAWNFQVFLSTGAPKYLRGWVTSLDFQHTIALLTVLPQQSHSIRVPRRPHARRKEFLYGTFRFLFQSFAASPPRKVIVFLRHPLRRNHGRRLRRARHAAIAGARADKSRRGNRGFLRGRPGHTS